MKIILLAINSCNSIVCHTLKLLHAMLQKYNGILDTSAILHATIYYFRHVTNGAISTDCKQFLCIVYVRVTLYFRCHNFITTIALLYLSTLNFVIFIYHFIYLLLYYYYCCCC